MSDPRILLERHFGYAAFRPGQEELVRAVLAGRDALGVLPTGGGKSVCYQVPALALPGVTLVVTPLISLMQDQVRRARAGGLRADYLSATRSADERRAVLAGARRGALDLLFVAPERLELESFRRALGDVEVRLLTVDEAHCISEWGHEFRPSYRRIGALRALVHCPVLALTATATPDVRRDVVESLGLRRPLVVVRSFDRPNLSWSVAERRGLPERIRETYRLLARRPGPAIVYAPTRSTVEAVRDRLAGFGVHTSSYHAGLPGPERTAVQTAFMEGRSRVVVATNAFGMGIDKADVRTVVHVGLPATLEAYYQEAGRAGRDGEASSCVAFWSPRDLKIARALARTAHPSGRELRAALRRLGRAGRDFGGRPFRARQLFPAIGAHELLVALSRIGAVRQVEACGSVGTGQCGGGFHDSWVYVDHRVDPRAALRRRTVVLSKLKAVNRFARAPGCRRKALLGYFGERGSGRCRRCDRCEHDLSI